MIFVVLFCKRSLNVSGRDVEVRNASLTRQRDIERKRKREREREREREKEGERETRKLIPIMNPSTFGQFFFHGDAGVIRRDSGAD